MGGDGCLLFAVGKMGVVDIFEPAATVEVIVLGSIDLAGNVGNAEETAAGEILGHNVVFRSYGVNNRIGHSINDIGIVGSDGDEFPVDGRTLV